MTLVRIVGIDFATVTKTPTLLGLRIPAPMTTVTSASVKVPVVLFHVRAAVPVAPFSSATLAAVLAPACALNPEVTSSSPASAAMSAWRCNSTFAEAQLLTSIAMPPIMIRPGAVSAVISATDPERSRLKLPIAAGQGLLIDIV